MNATELYEVKLGTFVPMEAMVILVETQEAEEIGVNEVAEGVNSKKKLLHVKGWLGVSRVGIDLLEDIDSAATCCQPLHARNLEWL